MLLCGRDDAPKSQPQVRNINTGDQSSESHVDTKHCCCCCCSFDAAWLQSITRNLICLCCWRLPTENSNPPPLAAEAVQSVQGRSCNPPLTIIDNLHIIYSGAGSHCWNVTHPLLTFSAQIWCQGLCKSVEKNKIKNWLRCYVIHL